MNLAANVETLLPNTLDANPIENKKHLKLIILTIRSLATKGLTFRGYKDDDVNFNATLETCVEASGEHFALHKKRVLGAYHPK